MSVKIVVGNVIQTVYYQMAGKYMKLKMSDKVRWKGISYVFNSFEIC